MTDPILVVGAARSGTSLVAGCVERCGAFGGLVRPGNVANPKGYFENKRIVDEVVKPLLVAARGDRNGQSPLPTKAAVEALVPEWTERVRTLVESIMREEGYSDGPWYYKCPKLALVWQVFHAAFPRAKWLIVRRPDRLIAESCLRTHFMRAYRDLADWYQWLDVFKECFADMAYYNLDLREVWSDKIAKGETKQLINAIEWCGLSWNSPAVLDFIDGSIYHGDEA